MAWVELGWVGFSKLDPRTLSSLAKHSEHC